jgi:hypothetical protein
MSERIYKFQPNRSIYFRGFSGIDSPASLHSATATGFTVSGVFRDPAAFWVLVIFDTDDFYHHPRLKALPDGSLSGIVLEFDVQYTGLAQLDTPFFPTIDFPYLDFIRMDGSTGRVDLSFGNIQTNLTGTSAYTLANTHPTTLTSGSHTAASVTIAVSCGSSVAGDVLTLWFENYAYSYTMVGSDNPTYVAAQLAAAVNAYSYSGNALALSATSSGANITITASPAGDVGNFIRLYWVATNSSRQNFQVAGVVTNPIQLSGGNSNVTFHVKIDFTALGIDSLRQAWLTFAPALANSAAYTDTTADAVFSNWGITADPHGISAQQVAGPGSVRVEETDAWTTAVGTWNTTDVGWFSKGFAIYSNTVGDHITITYWSQFTHDLWVGTSIYSDRGIFGVTVDGVAKPDLNMMAVTYATGSGGVTVGTPSTGGAISEAISTRRKIATGIAPGQHTVVLTVKAGQTPPAGISSYGYCYFDFLEAAVASDVPDPQGSWTDRAPAIDYDTQHGYQLAPQRLLWMIQKLGFAGGPIDEYVGVFWWNQRNNTTQSLAHASIDFSTVSPAVGDGLFLNLGGTTIGKSVFASETASTWAAHFSYYINEVFAGVWASVSGSVLTVAVRSSASAYQISTFSAYRNSTANPIAVTGSLTGSAAGTWLVDPTQSPALNYGAEKWHADLYATAAALGTSVVSAFSLEIVQPPDTAATAAAGTVGAANVWVCRFADGTAVETSTGFGVLNSSQCVPMAAPFLAYQKAAFMHLADLQTAAGLPVQLQCGEHLWWFFQEGGPFAGATGMAFWDDATRAAATAALGRPLHSFLTPNDDPSVNSYADANFLAARLNGHVTAIINTVQATYPSAQFEILWPADVNGPVETPISAVGGRLNAYISFPVQWQAQNTAPFQYFKLEYLAFLTSDRNMNFVETALTNMAALAWPKNKVRVLYTVDNPGVAQWRDYRAIQAKGFTNLTPWAFDQINLLGWEVEPPAIDVTAQTL